MIVDCALAFAAHLLRYVCAFVPVLDYPTPHTHRLRACVGRYVCYAHIAVRLHGYGCVTFIYAFTADYAFYILFTVTVGRFGLGGLLVVTFTRTRLRLTLLVYVGFYVV